MTSIDQITCLDHAKHALKGIVAEVEQAIGVQAALPITLPLLQAIDATDEAARSNHD